MTHSKQKIWTCCPPGQVWQALSLFFKISSLFLLFAATALPASWRQDFRPFSAAGRDFDDWTQADTRKSEAWEYLAVHNTPAVDQSAPLALLGEDLLWLWQHSLSGQGGSHCPWYPSCSRYSRIAVREYGLLAGVCLTADRLSRCHGAPNEQGAYAYRLIQGEWLIWDPPHADAWWHDDFEKRTPWPD